MALLRPALCFASLLFAAGCLGGPTSDWPSKDSPDDESSDDEGPRQDAGRGVPSSGADAGVSLIDAATANDDCSPMPSDASDAGAADAGGDAAVGTDARCDRDY